MDLSSNTDTESLKKDTITTNSLYDIHNTAIENLFVSLEKSDNCNLTISKNNLIDTTIIDLNETTCDLDSITINGPLSSNSSYLLSKKSSSNNLEADFKSEFGNKTRSKTEIQITDTLINNNETTEYLVKTELDEAQQNFSKQYLNVIDEISSTGTDNNKKENKLPIINDFITNASKLEEKEKYPERKSSSNQIDILEIMDLNIKSIKMYGTIEEFEKNLPQTVTILTTSFGSKVYLVGTAHFSEESQDDVSFVIRNVKPDIVMIELCLGRIHILKYDEKTFLEEAKNFNMTKIRNIINTNGFINGIFFILLMHMSAQLAKELGMAPGGEFRRAFYEVSRLPGCMLHLGDRPINITLQRALRALSFWQTLKLVWRLTSTETISIEEIEECKQRDLLEKLMKEMAGEFPSFSDVFVKERDLYLCHSLHVAAFPFTQQAKGSLKPVRVVGVVGIGHAAGIIQNWGKIDPNKIPDILTIPPASKGVIILKYITKYGTVALLAYCVYKFLRPKISKSF